MKPNKNVVEFLCKLEGYKTAVKNFHFSASCMSEHKLFDEIADIISENQDEIGEIEQGVHGQFGKDVIKAAPYKMSTSKKFLKDVLNETNEFYKSIQTSEYVGLRSVVENFIGEINKYVYLLDITIKEDFKYNFKKKLNESAVNGEYVDDAVEALSMSDGQIDFHEWSDAFEGADYNSLLTSWNRACDLAGFSGLKESRNTGKNKIMENKKTIEIGKKDFDNALHEAITNVIGRLLKENQEGEVEVKGGMYNDKELDYTHFAINKQTNLIVDGWGYSGHDSEELRQYKKDYFDDDLRANGYNPKVYKILSFKACQKQGIDPNNKQIWSNTGVYPLAQEIQMKNNGQNPFELAEKEHPDWFVEN